MERPAPIPLVFEAPFVVHRKGVNPSNFTKFLKHVVARDKVKDKISHINSRTVTDGLLVL